MPTILVSSNELGHGRTVLPNALTSVGFEVVSSELPFDFLLYTNRGPIPRERKVFPSDYISSAQDGRFAKECAAMREYSPYPGVIKEGRAFYTKSGQLRSGKRVTNWTRKGIRNLDRSLRYVEGCDIENTANLQETAALLWELQLYFDGTNHGSYRQRSRITSDWPKPTQQERFLHYLQGLPGVGIKHAVALSRVFQSPSHLNLATVEDIAHIPRLGRVLALNIYHFLHS